MVVRSSVCAILWLLLLLRSIITLGGGNLDKDDNDGDTDTDDDDDDDVVFVVVLS